MHNTQSMKLFYGTSGCNTEGDSGSPFCWFFQGSEMGHKAGWVGILIREKSHRKEHKEAKVRGQFRSAPILCIPPTGILKTSYLSDVWRDMQLFEPGFSYLIDMRVPVLVVLGLGLCAVDPGEKGWFGEVHQSRVQTKRLGYNVLDFPANLTDEGEQTARVRHRAREIGEEIMINRLIDNSCKRLKGPRADLLKHTKRLCGSPQFCFSRIFEN